jgi:hypothetical protein
MEPLVAVLLSKVIAKVPAVQRAKRVTELVGEYGFETADPVVVVDQPAKVNPVLERVPTL